MKKEISKLTIKVFSIDDVILGESTYIAKNVLSLNKSVVSKAHDNFTNYIKSINIDIIKKENRNIFVNSIMDFIPISTKVLGKVGEGITHTLTGVCVMLTGVDEKGIQVAEFGSSEGILNKHVILNTPGTPSDTDIIIHVDVVLYEGMGTVRKAILSSHLACDIIIQEIRECMKKLNGRSCDEKKDFIHTIDDSNMNIAIIKQVAGQGAMYDTHVLPSEPCGVKGGKSVIDMGNLPIVLTPNEYRDGAIRAMY
ncbi:proline reductase cluster protein PrdD [Sedimentibacter sp. zth1]|uniref:proline reductase cluster protein PrdD n=1 Tax=Sedimentibacter sp. zth1 TaxID=2816908 RepID=UPI001A92378F|nr:proline reductase cluster protein PrdD [Sedimentibacter sp. zth1]QSX05958.1 proline reductase cluster protein PrdD [Sedimentibacter sp. zth1]